MKAVLSPLRAWVRRRRAAARWYGQLLWFWRDARHAHRYMSWRRPTDDAWTLSAELLFQFHKLEKGLCMPPPRRHFGNDPLRVTVGLIDRWRRASLPTGDPIFVGAQATLAAYAARVEQIPPPPALQTTIGTLLDRGLQGHRPTAAQSTPIAAAGRDGADHASLEALLRARRSVRHFADDAVPVDDLRAAVAAAQLAPSACNRQPWRVHVYRDTALIARLLRWQNGNAGFGHRLRTLLVVTADSTGFFDASERHQAYVDGGLFTMALILALQSRGIASCCLNWCITSSAQDDGAHRDGGIPDRERIVMYVAVGYAAPDALVPRSPRRSVDAVLQLHDAPPGAECAP